MSGKCVKILHILLGMGTGDNRMLKLVHTISALSFSQLMNVYVESNTESGFDLYGQHLEFERLHLVESDFFHYLKSVFFRQEKSFYAIWEEGGRYVSAVRVEPYLDGFLLCALETCPQERCKGFAGKLILSICDYLSAMGADAIYSHVSKENIASLRVHMRCGFEIVENHAVFTDGSVSQNSCTLVYKMKKSEIH